VFIASFPSTFSMCFLYRTNSELFLKTEPPPRGWASNAESGWRLINDKHAGPTATGIPTRDDGRLKKSPDRRLLRRDPKPAVGGTTRSRCFPIELRSIEFGLGFKSINL